MKGYKLRISDRYTRTG